MVLATDCPSPYRNWTPGSWSSSPPRIDASSPRSCTFSPVRPPMIKSTVSGGALVTTSPSDAKSTRQRGVKHSITKRFTRRARWEVRLPSLGHRNAPRAPSGIVEPQVAGVLMKEGANQRTGVGSWLKIVVRRGAARKRRGVVRRSAARPSGGVRRTRAPEIFRTRPRPTPDAPRTRSGRAAKVRPGFAQDPPDVPLTCLGHPAEGPSAGHPGCAPDVLSVRPRGAPVRRAVPPVGEMALRSWSRSGILPETPGT